MAIRKIPWDKVVFFFDLDDNLINTAEVIDEASLDVEKALLEHVGEAKAKEVAENFRGIFNINLMGHQVKDEKDWERLGQEKKEIYERQMQRIGELEKNLTDLKKWSREVFAYIALEKAGIKPEKKLIHVMSDAYWLATGQKTTVNPGVVELFDAIREHGRPIFILTGSDARLKFDGEGNFIYDPDYSRQKKLERMAFLVDKGITYDDVSTGDPLDKPAKEFYENGFALGGEHCDLSDAVTSGDSQKADIDIPLSMGVGLGVLLRKGQPEVEEVNDNEIITGNLADLLKYLQ
jgi:phosphoserine phosphatase